MNATKTVDMILTCGSHVSARRVEWLVGFAPEAKPAIYRLPGGRYVVGYTEDDQVYEDPDTSPDDVSWTGEDA